MAGKWAKGGGADGFFWFLITQKTQTLWLKCFFRHAGSDEKRTAKGLERAGK